MLQKRAIAMFVIVLVVGSFAGPGFASELKTHQGHLTTISVTEKPFGAAGQELTDSEMDEITGEHVGQIIVGAVVAYIANEVFDYYGVDEWIQETAIPAVESAVMSAYETVVSSYEMVGEALMDDPYAWMW